MRHTNKLVLVPEELYHQSLQPVKDGSAIGMIRARMDQVAINQKMDNDEKEKKYNQEYKRYNKLVREQEERPVNVHLQNVDQIKEAIPPAPIVSVKVKRTNHPRVRMQRRQRMPAKTSIGANKVENDEVFEDAPSESIDTKALIMQQIAKNSNALGINAVGKMLKKIGGREVYKTASVRDIVDHILRHKGTKHLPLPIGYAEFLDRINSDPELKKLLLPQTGSGFIDIKPCKTAFKAKIWM